MALRILILILALGPMASPLQAGWFDNIASYFRKAGPETPPTVKVLIVHDKTGVVLEVKGKYKIFDPHTGDHLSTRFIGKRKFIQAVNDGIKWGEEFPGIHQILITPDDPSTTTIVDGIEYHGPIYVYDIGGTISIVNQVYVEDYLSSILAQRYREPLSEETLAAVAIAARTSVYYNVKSPKSEFWSVDAQKSGYQGFASINPSSPIEKAIESTRYMIMSRTSPNQGEIVPFLAQWKGEVKGSTGYEVSSQITLAEAEEMAKKGKDAAQILAKAFPGIRIELMHYSEPAKKSR